MNRVNYYPTAIKGIECKSQSAFLENDDNIPSNFSPYSNGGTPADPVSAVATALGSIADMLPKIGIGSKSRLKESQAEAAAGVTLEKAKGENLKLFQSQENKKQKNMEKIMLIGGVLLFLTVIFAGVFFGRRR